MRLLFRATLVVCFVCLSNAVLRAQDPFHIRVHTYEPLPPGAFTFELHGNYVGSGTKTPDGSTAPTNNQLHIAPELTAGITEQFSLGAMLLGGRRVSNAIEYAGWKVLPHWYAPASWCLPVLVGVVGEVTFGQSAYEKDSSVLEIHPVIERHIGKFTIVGNPGFGRTLRGAGAQEGWTFQSAAYAGVQISKRLRPGLEYFTQPPQFNHVRATTDVVLHENMFLNFGVGVGSTPQGSRIIYTTRIEYHF